jgi:hypothetical protein
MRTQHRSTSIMLIELDHPAAVRACRLAGQDGDPPRLDRQACGTKHPQTHSVQLHRPGKAARLAERIAGRPGLAWLAGMCDPRKDFVIACRRQHFGVARNNCEGLTADRAMRELARIFDQHASVVTTSRAEDVDEHRKFRLWLVVECFVVDRARESLIFDPVQEPGGVQPRLAILMAQLAGEFQTAFA